MKYVSNQVCRYLLIYPMRCRVTRAVMYLSCQALHGLKDTENTERREIGYEICINPRLQVPMGLPHVLQGDMGYDVSIN